MVEKAVVPAVVVESDYSNIYEIYSLAALKKFNFTSIIVSEGIETIGLDIVLESEAYYAVFTSLGLGDPTDLENGIYLPFMRYSEESKYIENLSTLILPDSLKIVGLFGLGGVRLNGTNTLIEIKNISTMLMNAFAETKVDEIRINLNATKTLSKISEYAFSNSTAQSISIGYGPTLIEASAFSGCTNLTELNIPLSVVTIENGAFDDCESLRVLNLGNARQIGRISNCSNLEKIDFDVLEEMKDADFYQCSALTAVIIRSPAVCTMGDSNAFKSTPIASGTGYVYVPAALVDSYKAATNWSVYADQIRAIEAYPDICGGAT